MLRIAICEDEEAHRLLAKNAVMNFSCQYGHEYELTVFETARELLASPASYDILLLDIRLEDGADGIEIGYELRKRKSQAAIILITSLNDRYKDGYLAEPVRYLKKPIEQQKFNEAMQAAIEQLSVSGRVAMFRFGQEHRFIGIDEILYIEAFGKAKRIYYGKTHEYFETRSTWREVEEQLPERIFYHIQNSYLINLTHVASCTHRSVTMTNGAEINISSGKYLMFLSSYMRNVKEE